jgi:TolB-like protein
VPCGVEEPIDSRLATSTLLLAVLLAASGGATDVAMGPFNFVEVSPELREFITAHVAQRLEQEGLSVITQRDVIAALGLERQRQLLGCTAETACSTEIVAALGADALLVGDVARVGGSIQVNLKLVSARTAKTKALASERVEGDRQLLPAIERVVHQLVLKARVATPVVSSTGALVPAIPQEDAVVILPPPPEPTGLHRRTVGFVALGLGVALAAGGGVLWGLSAADAHALRTGSDLGVDAALLKANQGANFQRAGLGLLAAGGAALATGVVLWLTDAGDTSLALAPTPTGLTASVQGHF